jgi:hypothetical protein
MATFSLITNCNGSGAEASFVQIYLSAELLFRLLEKKQQEHHLLVMTLSCKRPQALRAPDSKSLLQFPEINAW